LVVWRREWECFVVYRWKRRGEARREGDAKERQITNRELQSKWEKERYPVVFSSVHTNTVFNQIFFISFLISP
jgi:hypothetical protein